MSRSLINPVALIVVSLIAFWFASWLGAWFHKRGWNENEVSRDDFAFVVGGILTLLALIVGFTFSMAVTRYDQRKNCEEQEANSIGTEYLRISLLPAVEATKIHVLINNYLNQHILFYLTRDQDELYRIGVRTNDLQSELWSATSTSIDGAPSALSAFILSGMNDMLDSQSYTEAAWRNRIPISALVLVIIISILCNLLVGYTAHRRSALLLLILPIALSTTLFTIADIDSPPGGYIRVRPQNLESLVESLRSQ